MIVSSGPFFPAPFADCKQPWLNARSKVDRLVVLPGPIYHSHGASHMSTAGVVMCHCRPNRYMTNFLLPEQSQIVRSYSTLHMILPQGDDVGRKHPSRDVIFSGQNLAKKCKKLSHHMMFLSLKNKYFRHHVM